MLQLSKNKEGVGSMNMNIKNGVYLLLDKGKEQPKLQMQYPLVF